MSIYDFSQRQPRMGGAHDGGFVGIRDQHSVVGHSFIFAVSALTGRAGACRAITLLFCSPSGKADNQ